MGGERPKWISNILSVFKRKPEVQLIPQQRSRRFVKDTEVTIENGKVSVDELHVELIPDQPDEMARVIARSFRTRKTIVGNYNLKTGEFEIKDTD